MDEQISHLLEKVPRWKGLQPMATPLEGGITNQNFRIDVDNESFVLRVCSTNTDPLGIQRDHEFACTKIVAELGIGPEVIHYSPDDGILVARFLPGKPVSAAEARRPDTLKRIVASVKRYHAGPEFPGHFSASETVRDYHGLAVERGVEFPETVPRVFELVERIDNALEGVRKTVPCHNDLLAANFLDDGEKIWIVDWEYGAMGDPFFDLGNFSVNQELSDDEKSLLLVSYFGECRARDLAHLKLMMLASDLREAFWGFLQSGLSTLDFDYSAYARKHLDRFFSRASTAEFGSWLEQAARG